MHALAAGMCEGAGVLRRASIPTVTKFWGQQEANPAKSRIEVARKVQGSLLVHLEQLREKFMLYGCASWAHWFAFSSYLQSLWQFLCGSSIAGLSSPPTPRWRQAGAQAWRVAARER